MCDNLVDAKKVLKEGGRYIISLDGSNPEMTKINSDTTLEALQEQMKPGDYMLTMKKDQIYLKQIPAGGSGFHQVDNANPVLEKFGLIIPPISSKYGIDIIN